MLEAVNSALGNATFMRQAAEQVSSARSYTPASPIAPYLSPYVYLDSNFDAAVLQIRDSNTGDVLRQYPSPEVLKARQLREIESQLQQQALQQQLAESSVDSTPVASAPNSSISNSTYTEAQLIASAAEPVSAPVQVSSPAPVVAPSTSVSNPVSASVSAVAAAVSAPVASSASAPTSTISVDV